MSTVQRKELIHSRHLETESPNNMVLALVNHICPPQLCQNTEDHVTEGTCGRAVSEE